MEANLFLIISSASLNLKTIISFLTIIGLFGNMPEKLKKLAILLFADSLADSLPNPKHKPWVDSETDICLNDQAFIS